jgi:ubiquinone/menaquinone biosynthesis C-methylase UbiE
LNRIEGILGGIEGGRVLDVATQEGHFVQILMDNLKSYTEIVGVDINEGAIESARSNFGREDVGFRVMDAERLDFENGCFDTVTISASLHHLSNIPQVLREMVRVLKPGGLFILIEMHQDGQTEAELTSVYLHQWVAEVDSALGHLHNSTLARQEFSDYIADLGLRNTIIYYDSDEDSGPMEEARIKQLDDLIQKTMQRAENAINYPALRERGEQLRQRLHKIGARREPIIIVYGEK